jgi:hypothetical protein
MCAVFVNAQDSDVSISEILQAVQKNVALLKELNTNLVAEEEITIEEFDENRKIKKKTEVISEYRIIPTKSEGLFSYGVPQEERTVLSAKENGKVKKIKKFVEPKSIFWTINSCTDFFVLFVKQNEEHFKYELNGTDLSVLIDKQNERYSYYKFNEIEKFKGRNVYIIDIEQKEAEIGKLGSYWRWNIKYIGVALVDIETMEIVQINRRRVIMNRYLNSIIGLGARRAIHLNYHFVQHEYDKVKINDQFLTLPVAKTVEVYRMNGQLDTVYKYKYSNYKEFTVDTKIEYGEID